MLLMFLTNPMGAYGMMMTADDPPVVDPYTNTNPRVKNNN